MTERLDREQVIVRQINDLLIRGAASRPRFRARIENLARRHGPFVYPVVIHALSHLEFDAARAERHWRSLWRRQEEMSARLGSGVDFRVAMLSYFLEMSRKIKNPKIIEIRVFQRTQHGIYVDELTGLHNYRYFRDALEREVQRVRRYQIPLSLVMIDIDDFKRLNDGAGHLAGNRALVRVAQALRKCVREVDCVARYGGEEFAMILPDTPKEGAMHVANRARLRIGALNVALPAAPPLRVTVSAGVAQYGTDADSSDNLIQKADHALYVSKSRGKDMATPYAVEKRTYVRVEAMIVGRVARSPSAQALFRAENASEGGLLFYTDRALPVSSLVDLNLTLPRRRRTLKCRAMVARIHEVQGSKDYEVGVKIVEMPKVDKRLFRRYLEQTIAESKRARPPRRRRSSASVPSRKSG